MDHQDYFSYLSLCASLFQCLKKKKKKELLN